MTRMRRAFVAAAAPAALIAVLASPSLAVVTSTWTVETYQQFDQGDATSAFITSLGEIKPGWDTRRVPLEGDGVWSALRLRSEEHTSELQSQSNLVCRPLP